MNNYDKVGFSAADSVTSLKLVEQGVPKDKLSMLAIPLIPLQILFPLLISRYTGGRGSRPMDVWLKAMVPRLLIGLSFAGIVYVTPTFQGRIIFSQMFVSVSNVSAGFRPETRPSAFRLLHLRVKSCLTDL